MESPSPELSQVVKKYEVLKKSWSAGRISDCGKHLDDVKVALTTLSFLPVDGSNVSEKELFIIREILEIGAQFSVQVKDIRAFERYMAYLRTYYKGYERVLPESAKMYELLGLNLLNLLSQNRLVEFHTELETLPASVLLHNPYVGISVRLERFIMVGSYNKVIDIKDSVPAESYKVFIDILLDTMRGEIGSCIEKAYKEISVAGCCEMLNVTPEQLTELAANRGWQIRGNSICFDQAACDEDKVPAKEIAAMVLSYAREMEKIV